MQLIAVTAGCRFEKKDKRREIERKSVCLRECKRGKGMRKVKRDEHNVRCKEKERERERKKANDSP